MSKAKKDGLQRTPKCAILLSNAVAVQFTPDCVVDTEEGRESGHDGKSSLQQVTAMELFEAFKRENKALHTRVNESLEELRLSGWIEPYTILIKGPNEDLELVREMWKRHLLRSPNKFVIRDVGEISSVGMDVIQQAPFMPLTKALHEAIKSMNESKETATQESIAKFLRENYQYVHIPSMNIIYDCLGLLIKERMVYHTGSGYFINTHNRAGKSAETSNVTSEGSANKENDVEEVTKKKAVNEIPGNSKKKNHEKSSQTGDSSPQKHTRSSLDTNGKTSDKKNRKESEQSAFPNTSHKTDAEQVANNHSKSTEPPSSFSNPNKSEKEKKQTDTNSGLSESSGSQSDEGRIKRGFLGRMSSRRAKADKEITTEEETKRPKEKKSVLNQLASFIKNRSQSSDTANGSPSNANSNALSPAQQSVTKETHEQINQSCPPNQQISQSYSPHEQISQSRSPREQLRQFCTPHEQNVYFRKEENSPRNSPGQTQRGVSVTRKQYDEGNEDTSPTFTRSRSFMAASKKRPSEVARSNSFTSNRTNKRKEQTAIPKMDRENISYSAWTSSISTPQKGPCAVGVVRPLSQYLGSQNGHVQRRPQSASSSGRSSSLKETTRPYSVPHAADLSQESWSKQLPKEDRGIGRRKSFGNSQKERTISPEKSFRMGEQKLHPGTLPPQNYSAYSNNRLSLNGSRMRTVAVPINGTYENSPKTYHRKDSPRAPARYKATPAEKRNLETSVGEYSQHAHVQCTDAYCTSPICNDKCRINELKPINCKCNEHEEGLAGDACANISESNQLPSLRPFEKMLQDDVSSLTKRSDSADICLDEVSSTSGSEFAAEMKIENNQSAYILSRTAVEPADQTSYCAPYQYAPEETKINSSLTFIGII